MMCFPLAAMTKPPRVANIDRRRSGPVGTMGGLAPLQCGDGQGCQPRTVPGAPRPPRRRAAPPWRRRGDRADRAGAPAQRRQRPPVSPRQRLPLPHRLRRARRLAGGRGRRPDHPRLPAQGRRARDLGRLSPRPRRRPGGARCRCGAAARRARPADGREDRQPALGLDSLRHAGAAGAARRLAGSASGRASARATRRRGCSTTWPRCWPRCASSRTAASWRRCAAPPRSAPAPMPGRCAFAPRASAAIRRPAFPNTRSRPSCCTSSAATAPTARPTARSSPPAATPACSTTCPSRTELRPGQLCLIDAGCELDGYASDVTRTFPADGRFTPAQRELYDIVEAAQAAALAATHPGARQRDAHAAAVRVLAQGMLDTGLLDRSKAGDVDAVIESAAYRQFYMHGTGHWLGRDVHDVGDYHSAERSAGGAARLGRRQGGEEALAQARAGHGGDDRAGPLRPRRRRRARALLGHRHPDRGRRRRHRPRAARSSAAACRSRPPRSKR